MERSEFKRRRRRSIKVTAIVGVIALAAAVLFYESPPVRHARILREQTTHLPAINRVEILRIGDPATSPTRQDFVIQPAIEYAGYAPILQSVTVSGAAAQDLAKLWRSRSFGGGGDMCHEPPYALRFFRGSKLIFETSVCWECRNCFVSTGRGDYDWLGFADEDDELLNELKKLLPLPAQAKLAE